MKTTKEFPATHSMSTQWFVVDEEGNIALFDFDENGPVPVNIPSEKNSDLMTAEEDLGAKDENSIEYFELTDEQVEELMSNAVSPLEYDIENDYALFVQVDEANKNEFLEVFSDSIECCLSHKHDIYFLWALFGYSESDLNKKRRLETFYKAVKRVVHIYIDSVTDEDFSGEDKNWTLPFYCYKQPYWSYTELAKRTNVPKFPFKENQIPENQRHKLLRVPLKFSECTGFQIAQYVICHWHMGRDSIEIEDRVYTKFPKTGGGFCYILDYQNEKQDGKTPIVLDLEE